MNKPRSDRMQRIADLAGYRTDMAATLVARHLREMDAAQSQLHELEQFRQDYARTVPTAQQSATTATGLLNRQRFVARIDAAIAQQREEVERASARLVAARAGWIKARSRSSALDTVTQRYRNSEQASEDRAEQATADEHAQRQSQPWGQRGTTLR